MILLPLDQAMRSHGPFLQRRLQGLLQKEGTFLYLPPHTEKTLDLEESPLWQISLGKNARLTLFNAHPATIDCLLEEGALLTLYDRGPKTTLRSSLKKESRLSTFTFSMQGHHTYRAELLEEEAEVRFTGLSAVKAARAETSIYVEHAAPHCRSHQHFKSLLGREGIFDFTGHIYVRPIAQKTAAYQLNQNWLLDPTAKAYTKPNLEIFADDVKASHGATASQIDPEELFYLQARGIPAFEAKQLLVQGFCKELLDPLPSSPWKEEVLRSLSSFWAP